MTVSVLVPVFDAANFVAETAASILAQTHTDLRIVFAVEPGGADRPHEPEASLAALAPFRADGRVEIRTNPVRLGWTGNIDALLAAVDTPYFAILPHDDLWHLRYVETLLGELEAAPDASVAYTDLRLLAGRQTFRRALPIRRDTDSIGQLFDFFLEGPLAMPWRGLTRTASLARTGGFPSEEGIGRYAETEYALRLIAAGRVVHHPAALFVKRMPAGPSKSASGARNAAAPALRREGLGATWENMRAIADGMLSAAAATDARRQLFGTLFLARRAAQTHGVLGEAVADVDRTRIEAALQAVLAMPECRSAAEGASAESTLAARIAAQCHAVLGADARLREDCSEAERHAAAAMALAPTDPGVLVSYGRVLTHLGRTLEAVEVLDRALRTSPNPRPIAQLLAAAIPPARR